MFNILTAMIFTVAGHHSQYGDYHGELELRPTAGEVLEIRRVITYDSFRFEGFQVQEVWSGTGHITGRHVSAEFTLKRANIFNSVDGAARTSEQFRTPLKIAYEFDLDAEPEARIALASGAQAVDEISVEARPAGSQPLWEDQRRALPSYGKNFPVLGKVVQKTLLSSIINAYRNDPFVKAHSDHQEYRDKMQYFVVDPTDFEFLRANPGVLRVDNKVTDMIALVEASLRRDAYGPALVKKAAEFDRQLTHDHLNTFGLYETALLDSTGRVSGAAANGDGGLWSGMYAGAEAMRWLVTREPEALDNFRRVLKGMMLLMDVTGDPREFARTVVPMDSQPVAPPWHKGTGANEGLKWLEGGNNDMIKGLLHALIWAYEVLPASDPLLIEVSRYSRRLPDLKLTQELNHPQNLMLATGLNAIATGDPIDLRAFLRINKWLVGTVDALNLDSGFYYGGIADWSGINLGMVARISDILLANRLAKTFGASTNLSNAVNGARQGLMDTWSIYAGARRDSLVIAAHTFAELPAAIAFVTPPAPAQISAPSSWASDIGTAVWGLREIPVQRAFHAIGYDYSERPDWSVSAWPYMPWKSFRDEKNMSFFYQGATTFPLFEGVALQSDNVWTSAFDFRGGSNKQVRNGRIDYLYVYWMARLGELISAQE